MAGDWIKIEVCLPDKPEVWQIANELSLDPDAVIGKLIRVWSWFDAHTIDGNAPVTVAALLDRYTSVPGFARAMVRCGWLAEIDGRLIVSNFDRHNSQSAKQRALTSKRVVKHRRKSNDECNADVTPPALPREEKRREEENTNTSASPTACVESPPRKKTKQPQHSFTLEDRALAEYLADCIAAAYPSAKPPNLDSWANDVRLMRERDGRTHDDIRALFAWAHADDFWRANIRSPCKLREKWDTLAAQRARPKAASPRKTTLDDYPEI